MNRQTKLHRAICNLDETEIRKLSPIEPPASPLTFWAAIHKARAALTMATPAQQMESRNWLAAHGSKPWGAA